MTHDTSYCWCTWKGSQRLRNRTRKIGNQKKYRYHPDHSDFLEIPPAKAGVKTLQGVNNNNDVDMAKKGKTT